MYLSPTAMKRAEYAINHHWCMAQHGVGIEDIQKPEFWAHHVKDLKQWDRIDVVAEDGSYMAELVVTKIRDNIVTVRVLHIHDLVEAIAKPDAPNPSDLQVEWAGPHHKWRVLRATDKTVVKTGFASQQEGNDWLKEHLKAA